MASPVSVSVSEALDEAGNPGLCLKLQGRDWEVNVFLAPQEAELIPHTKTARWEERGSLRIGLCAGSPTYWSCQGDELSILVGHDPETWEIGVTVPIEAIDEILAEIQREGRK